MMAIRDEHTAQLLNAITAGQFEEARSLFEGVAHPWLRPSTVPRRGSTYARRRLSLDWRPSWFERLATTFWIEEAPGAFAVKDRGEPILIGYDHVYVLRSETTDEQIALLQEIGVLPAKC
jgi:hypothetical protein